MKKIIALFLCTTTIFTNQIICMKRQICTNSDQPTKKHKLKKATALPFLPRELQKKIFIDHFHGDISTISFVTTCEFVNTLSLLNRQWNNYINKPNTIRTIINIIKDYIGPYTVYEIAKTISTYGTKNYIQQNYALYHKIIGAIPRSPFSIEDLITNGADVNYLNLNKHSLFFEGHFLSLASIRNNYTYTKQLLDCNADLNAIHKGKTALSHVIRNKDLNMIQLLLQYNPKNKCLTTIVKNGDPVIMNFYLTNVKLTQDELEQGYRYALKMNADNKAAELLVDHYFSNI